MSSAIQAVDIAIKKIQQQISGMNADSDNFLNLSEKLTQLLIRRNLLKTYSEEMVQRIEKVNGDIDKRKEELEGERAERIANIKHEFEQKVAALPAIADVKVIQEAVVKPGSTEIKPTEFIDEITQELKKYIKRYSDYYPTSVSDKENFFRALSFSHHCRRCYSFALPPFKTYISITHYKNGIDDDVKAWFLAAELQADTSFPLSLIHVDRIIHSNCSNTFPIVIWDTSLNVILFNFSMSNNSHEAYFLTYDSELKRFAPLFFNSKKRIYDNKFCQKCFDILSEQHECKPHCPICLRSGNPSDIGCSKETPESTPLICGNCDAFCQTVECFDAHAKICPRPFTQLQQNAVKIIKRIHFR